MYAIRSYYAFDQRNGQLVLGLEGGHSKRRILHAGGDATGRELTCFMLKNRITSYNVCYTKLLREYFDVVIVAQRDADGIIQVKIIMKGYRFVIVNVM